ncbi:hypothetical protein GR183_12485 [Stappia sp. GBMRC 2046]|uniref:Extensin-like C-terminal domain-containing protein n=1 Tax=Stappia sediminis TaxID=2692190 RepID=A0A7X3LV74_9HYPH|nr:extensin family protein [Stappia sediminis]MXN65724.1 hypothetical protein [Stappia sediminis]
MTLVRVDNISGISLFYDRFKSGSYGNEAVAMRPFIDQKFFGICEKAVATIRDALSKGEYEIKQIWSGGVGRSGNGRSYHHKNRAFDLDALIFADNTKWVANTFPDRPYIYLAIEACLRTKFGTVLNYDYNKAHEDHFHFDNGTTVRFKREARSHVLFLQHTLMKLFNQDIGESGADGIFGPDTDAALSRVRKQINIGGLSGKQNWLRYLEVCAEVAILNEKSIVSVDGPSA